MIQNQPLEYQRRFNWIDQTKGLAIFAILVFHFFQNYPERIQLISILDRNLAKLGYAAVDIFFVMAGFNTSYSLFSKLIKSKSNDFKINWRSWLTKRLLRIYPAYILAVILSCLLYYLFSTFKIKSSTNFILTCLGIAGIKFQAINPGFWFFTVILEAYIFTPLIFYICRNRPKKILWLGLIFAILTKFISIYFLQKNNIPNYLFFLQNNFLGSYIFQFCLGIYWGYIYAEKQAFRKIDFIISTIVFSLGLAFYLVLGITKINIIYMLGFDILFTPFFFWGIQALLSRLDKIAKLEWILSFTSMLGIYSYQIYLIHQPLYFVFLPKFNNSLQANVYLKIMLSLVLLTILLAIYTFLFTKLEKLVTSKLLTVISKSK
ncbi:MAG: acyltransferase family protein [Aulosira sp. ZfuVER01]|nr:acyltransferase [Aulosira sp. ZfuVER01]MDZ7998477.1 acyltransferase [Aulosira sp. DedVER01a]MDZ8052179.1 acyltransferase [Aulosira sp. ZfuCHP01]